ncbi:DUF2135 domain-containing protein [Serratia microhaemolytica]|uniref:YfaP family protein n=1 Tax=Serratia microhaemolytica TaxID=2675110 RepID=UPI000FDDAB73
MMVRYCCFSLWLIAYSHAAIAEQQVVLDAPRSGWYSRSGVNAQFSQQVNYPASSVNTPANQSRQALISGQIKNRPKQSYAELQQPGLLIANGVAMPLAIDTDGHFQRPYMFAQGSNNVEVRSPDRSARQRTQFYANTGAGALAPRLRIVLSWDSNYTDLDLHVISPDGQHVFYGHRQAANGGALDIDVTTGYGPEIFATPAPLNGQYLVYLNYYNGQGREVLTTAQITIVSEEGTINEKQETVLVPMRNPGELTLVKKVTYTKAD